MDSVVFSHHASFLSDRELLVKMFHFRSVTRPIDYFRGGFPETESTTVENFDHGSKPIRPPNTDSRHTKMFTAIR